MGSSCRPEILDADLVSHPDARSEAATLVGKRVRVSVREVSEKGRGTATPHRPCVTGLMAIVAILSACAPSALPAQADGQRGSEAPPVSVGMDAAALDRLDPLIDSALAAGVAPGAALVVGRHGRIVRMRGYGTLDGPGSAAVTPETIWDMASLTKVIGTTTAVMQLIDAGRLSLDDRVVEHLPWWAEGDPRKGQVTVRQLLLHRAGLPAFRRWFLEMQGRPAYIEAIGNEPLDSEPGSGTVYSDIGVMTLALIVEEITGQRLDAYLEAELFARLGMGDTDFLPAASLRSRIAPTEIDELRGGKMHGRVHDENADAFGGVAGHAGLFSSARDLAVFAQLMLDEGRVRECDSAQAGAPCRMDADGGERVMESATVELFTGRYDATSSRAFGWDTPDGRSSAGDYFGRRAFGHTGYTGTSIWIDPELDLFVILLTNRVNPTRENSRHVPFRRAVHDAVAQAILDQPVSPREAGTPDTPEN